MHFYGSIIIVVLIMTVLIGIDPLVDGYFRSLFENLNIQRRPSLTFEKYYSSTRIELTKSLLYQLWFVALIAYLNVLRVDYNLIRYEKQGTGTRGDLFAVFVQRILGYVLLFFVAFMSLSFFDSEKAILMTKLDRIILIGMLIVGLNIFALFPYLAQQGIAHFIRLKDVIIFNTGMILMYAVLMFLNVTQYAVIGMAQGVFALTFIKNIKRSLKEMEAFFEIKDKKFFEMFV